MDRFFPFIEAAVPGKTRQFPGGDPLIYIIHGEIGIFPLTEYAEPRKFFFLCIDEFCGVGTALFPHLGFGDFMFLRTEIFLNLQFDRQAVAVPARHIGRVKPAHSLAFQDYVLENFVQCMADMDVTVCIGRAVMKDIVRFVPADLSQFCIEIHLFPTFQYFQFFLGQVCLHGELCCRQVQGVFVFHNK